MFEVTEPRRHFYLKLIKFHKCSKATTSKTIQAN